jgi:hypothetical protein
LETVAVSTVFRNSINSRSGVGIVIRPQAHARGYNPVP